MIVNCQLLRGSGCRHSQVACVCTIPQSPSLRLECHAHPFDCNVTHPHGPGLYSLATPCHTGPKSMNGSAAHLHGCNVAADARVPCRQRTGNAPASNGATVARGVALPPSVTHEVLPAASLCLPPLEPSLLKARRHACPRAPYHPYSRSPAHHPPPAGGSSSGSGRRRQQRAEWQMLTNPVPVMRMWATALAHTARKLC